LLPSAARHWKIIKGDIVNAGLLDGAETDGLDFK
jgi:hypothetical protein